jgi:hypothetical protein
VASSFPPPPGPERVEGLAKSRQVDASPATKHYAHPSPDKGVSHAPCPVCRRRVKTDPLSAGENGPSPRL